MKSRTPHYINGIGVLSPQPTFINDNFLPSINEYNQNVLSVVHPDFKEFINPVQIRRLSRMHRIGLTAATICVRDSKNLNPTGIITATGFGFLGETAKFMNEILQQDEKQLTPTFFMQSTYNALSGLIALTLKCMGYNNTFVGRGHAFETALQDAMLNLKDEDSNFLVGGFDEAGPIDFKVLSRAGCYKKNEINNLKLFTSETEGTLQGESAAFFMIGKKQTKTSWCRLMDLEMVYNPADSEELIESLNSFLESNKVAFGDIDVVVSGQSGDPSKDEVILKVMSSCFEKTQQVQFKHLAGEFCTSTTFGLWLAASIIMHQTIPEVVKANSKISLAGVKTVLIFNHYQSKNFTFILTKQL